MHELNNNTLWREACYIDGEWCQADNKTTFPVDNPANQTIIGHVPNCGKAETGRAIDAAKKALPQWQALSARERGQILWRLARLIDANKKDLSCIMTTEQGKPLKEAIGEIDYANDYIKWYAEEGLRVYGDIIPANQSSKRIQVLRQPIGVVAMITPWNFPAAMLMRKLAPALAAGCTVVAKPAPETPFTALALMALAEEAGVPRGVLNMLTGDATLIGAEMTANETVRKVSFTGSTAVGRLLMAQCAPTIKKLSLELGGNAPFIVFDDADIDAAVSGAIISKFRNSGQTCVCANRIYVHDRVYDSFAKKLVQSVAALKVGSGFLPDIQQGPLINEKALQKVKEHVADAIAQGATLQCGGKLHALGGLFFEPTVLTEVNANMRLAQEETFGPVAPLFRFNRDEEVINMANATPFGLAAYFYTRDVTRIYNVAEKLEYGMVGINTGLISAANVPFGGIKQSGLGREGSKYGIDDYLEMKYVCLALDT